MAIERVHLMLAAGHAVEHGLELLFAANRCTVPHDGGGGEVECGDEVGALGRIGCSVVGRDKGLCCFGSKIGQSARVGTLIAM